ncbi:hypothetical protein EJ04DRAFT_575908 [Polyplosphaeria fusca]|uniref:Uncharacterized protein n=1 Tax=Polyplosphaeria fusca TaxID=682080 RepID=A0A9P4R2D5_9PLEO|nr:hypothetical protein EJ04DRAFT_575908 [Polyplosphaeria fusca]
MDKLPLELVQLILEAIQAGDDDALGFHATDNFRPDTSSFRNSVCNARLVSRMFSQASHAIFAQLLGHRRVRFTEAGLQDLQDISEAKALQPHIRTLTFGMASFNGLARLSTLPHILRHMHVEDWREQMLLLDFKECYQAQERLDEQSIKQILCEAFRRLPNLHNVLVIYGDHVDCRESHLKGWLPSYDQEAFRDAFDRYYGPRSSADYSLYHDHVKPFFIPAIFASLHEARSRLKVLSLAFRGYEWKTTRVSTPAIKTIFWRLATDYNLPLSRFSNLRVFRSTVKIEPYEHDDRQDWVVLAKTIQDMPMLEEIVLDLVAPTPVDAIGNRYLQNQISMGHYQRLASSAILKALIARNIKYLTFNGAWFFSEDELATFISNQSGTISSLTFLETTVFQGSWSSLLTKLSVCSLPKLKNVTIIDPYEVDLHRGYHNRRGVDLKENISSVLPLSSLGYELAVTNVVAEAKD